MESTLDEAAHVQRLCPVCGNNKHKRLGRYSVDSWSIVRCEACDMVYLSNPPAPELVKSEFDWEHQKSSERKRRREKMGQLYYGVSDSMKWIRSVLRSFGPRKEVRYITRYATGPRILDVGCGGGHFLASLPDGYVPHGIEPSPGLHAMADREFRKKDGYCIQNISHLGFGELPDGAEFDLVLMRSFLEHDVMAAQTLRECHKKLSSGGKVLIKVPNIGCFNARLRGANWPGIRNPDHVNYFTPRTLRRMLFNCGYSKVCIPLLWRLPTSDNLWALAHK